MLKFVDWWDDRPATPRQNSRPCRRCRRTMNRLVRCPIQIAGRQVQEGGQRCARIRKVGRSVTAFATKVVLAEGGLLPDSDTDSTGNMALKLLVIDDHPLILEGVAAALEGLGHGVRIVAARTAEKGLAARGSESGSRPGFAGRGAARRERLCAHRQAARALSDAAHRGALRARRRGERQSRHECRRNGLRAEVFRHARTHQRAEERARRQRDSADLVRTTTAASIEMASASG